MKKICLIIIFLFFTAHIVRAQYVPGTNNILYVKQNATGSGNGSSWNNAVPDLANALKWAHTNRANFVNNPLQIWVAGGTYTPKYSPEDGSTFGTNQNRKNSFLMVNNVKLYGGFAGTETSLSSRNLNLTANKSILSGDIGILNNTSDNCLHVVIAVGNVGSATLNGFTVTKGNANQSGNFNVNSTNVSNFAGAGVYNRNTSMTIDYTTFEELNSEYGSGIYLINSPMNITNSVFNNNTATEGACINTLNDTYTGQYGKIVNCVFSNNFVSGSGCVLFFEDGPPNSNRLEFINCTFANNTAYNQGGLINYYTDQTGPAPAFKNCIIDSPANEVLFYGNNFSKFVNILFANCMTNSSALTTNPSNINNLINANPLFVDPSQNNFRLQNNSPAINIGNNIYLPSTTTTDIEGNSRIVNSTVDLGAYENQSLPETPAPTATNQTFCSNLNATVANLVATGSNIKWYNSATSTNPLTTTTPLTTGNYFATQTINGIESILRTQILVTITNTPAPTTNNQTFCPNQNATVASLVVTGTAIKWYSSATTTTPLAVTTALASGNYFATQTVNNCESTRTQITVTISNTAAPTGSNQTFCASSNPTVANLIATGTAIKWYNSATATTPLAATTALVSGNYFASQTVNNCESTTRKQITVTITNTAAPTAVNQTFCANQNATVANLVATGTTIKWYSSATATTPLTLTTALASGSYFTTQTINNCESTRTQITVTITNSAAPTAVNQSFCPNQNATVANLVATGNAIKWYNSETATTPLTATIVLVSGNYFATQTVNNCESTRTQITVTIANTAAPTAVNQSFCPNQNATVGNLVATGTAIKWYSSATATTPLAVTTALVSGNYFATQTINNCESTTRKQVTVTITNTAAPTGSNQTFCASSNPTVANLIATGTAIKWYNSATATTELAATTPLVAGNYFASQTLNNCESTTRKQITVTITNTAAPTASNQTFCANQNATVANLVATGTAIKWYSSATATTPLAGTIALTSGSYFATQTLNNCESTRTQITVTITNTAAPTASNQTFCANQNATVANLVATGTAIKWYSSATSTTPLSTTTALVSGNYFATQTLNNCESNRTQITVTITNTAAPTASNQTFCTNQNATVANLVVTGTTIKWYSSATATSPLAATTALVSGNYFASQTQNNCESTRTQITVTITNPTAPTALNQTFCTNQNATVANLVANGSNIKWYSSANSTTPLTPTTAIVSGNYFVTQTINNCESTRTQITVTITNTAAPTASNQSFCANQNATIANLVATGSNIKWYSSANSTTSLTPTTALVSGNYFASQTVNNCESLRIQITVTIGNIAAPTTVNQTQEFCSNTNPNLSSLVINGTDIKWYSSATATTPLNNNTLLANGLIYYASQTLNGCESANRTAITVTINNVPQIPTANTIQEFCGFATIADLEVSGVNGAEILWYASSISLNPLPINTILTNATYYVTQKVGACTSDRKAITVRVTNQAAPNLNAFEFCGSATVADLYIPVPTGVTYKWYNSPSSTNQLTSTTPLNTGNYFVSRVQFGCESLRAQVSVLIKDLPDSPTGVSPQIFIEGSVLNQIIINPTTAVYYITEEDARTSTNPLSLNMPLVNGTTYYAVVIGTNGCPSLPLPITVDVYLSNNEFEKDKLKYYPNPVDDKLQIEYFENIVQVDVYDLLGRKIKSINTNNRNVEIDLSELSAATYMIQLQTETKQQFIKIIKQ
ncbi:T9SS C-terminal target domain-containing protein [Paenimyroides tangerinum]|uniref:T9SS C-terminal target domain-containing protein n=1 Tax=Paenimyroides tangerinum TaxID=2488728 RepID=A0A3P3W756_9FLAO|nr:T9SS type A sorting domain-containing protein [Paenimyroides tangerinum]RRJ88503.1 T9SS C-terminal target domain-containing protein [Paenimyroides tangerinum]